MSFISCPRGLLRSAFALILGMLPVVASAEISLKQVDLNQIELDFKVPAYQIKPTTIGNQAYAEIQAEGARVLDEKGEPALPQFSMDLLIPFNATAPQVALEDATWEQIPSAPVLPSKGSIERTQDPDQVPYTFSSTYQGNAPYPRAAVEAGQPFQLRDTRGVNLRIQPFRYDFAKRQLWVLKQGKFIVKLQGVRGESLRALRTEPAVNQEFLNLYQTHFKNFTQALAADRVTHLVPDASRVLIITHPKFEAALADFVKWKTRKGMEVAVEKIATQGATHAEVMSLVRKHYQDRKIAHVILIGDAEDMPYYPGKSGNAVNNEADPMYGLLEGEDSYPELFVSRISAKTPTDVLTSLSKSIRYESMPEKSGDWYSKGVGIASDEGASTGMKDRERADVLRQALLGWHYKSVDQIYDPSANLNALMSGINQGRGFINYIGHGSTTAWVTSGMDTNDIDQLENGGRLPFIVSVACVNGNFKYSGSDSFAERWIKAGSPDRPKGAVAIFASSTNQSWVPPTVGQRAITDLLIQRQYRTAAALFTHGSIAVLEDNSSSALQTFETWHTFGDGTVELRTQKPKQIALQAPQTLREGAKKFELNVGEEGLQVGVTVNGRLIGTAISNAQGVAQVTFKECPKAGDRLNLLVTGFNRIPAESEATVTL